MILGKPPITADTHVLCDWLEIATLASEFQSYAIDTLSRSFDVRRNKEGRDSEDGDYTEEEFHEKIRAEVEARLDLLKDCYPFRFSASGESLEISLDDCTEGAIIYLFCLLLSHTKKGEVLNGKFLPSINNAVRNLFQACATYAAAGEVSGHAFAFGFPRPGNTPFNKKVTAIYKVFGENVTLRSPPMPGAARAVKDAQIDIIAWQPRPDEAAGKMYMLGQVASGANWSAKTIKGGPIDAFHGVYLNPVPASQATPAIFVPFAYGSLSDGTCAAALHVHTFQFGNVFHRFRIPHYSKLGLEIARREPKQFTVERLTDMPLIKKWVFKESKRMQTEHARQ